jgi:hypothetical protein
VSGSSEIDPRKPIWAKRRGNRVARIGDLPEMPVVSDRSARGRNDAEIDHALRIIMPISQALEGRKNPMRAGRNSWGEKPHAVGGRAGIDIRALGVE